MSDRVSGGDRWGWRVAAAVALGWAVVATSLLAGTLAGWWPAGRSAGAGGGASIRPVTPNGVGWTADGRHLVVWTRGWDDAIWVYEEQGGRLTLQRYLHQRRPASAKWGTWGGPAVDVDWCAQRDQLLVLHVPPVGVPGVGDLEAVDLSTGEATALAKGVWRAIWGPGDPASGSVTAALPGPHGVVLAVIVGGPGGPGVEGARADPIAWLGADVLLAGEWAQGPSRSPRLALLGSRAPSWDRLARLTPERVGPATVRLPNGQRQVWFAAAGDETQPPGIWSVDQEGSVRQVVSGDTGRVLGFWASPNGSSIAIAERVEQGVTPSSTQVRFLFLGAAVTPVPPFPLPVALEIDSVAWSPRGDVAAIVLRLSESPLAGRSRIIIWRPETGSIVASLPSRGMSCAAWSPNGTYLAVASPGRVDLYDAQGRLLSTARLQPPRREPA